MRLHITDSESFGAGIVFVILAAGFFFAITGAEHGSLSRMGPGYLPRYAAGLLGLIGLVQILRGLRPRGRRLPPIRLRALIFPLAAVLLFSLLLKPGGLALAAFLTVLVAAAATPRHDWPQVVVLALGLAVGSCLLFPLALGLPLPIWPGVLQ